MRNLCFSLTVLFSLNGMAFPNLNLRFSCPNPNGSLLQLSFNPTGPDQWDANLLETSGDELIRALGGLRAKFNGIPDEVEVSGVNGYFAVLTQTGSNEAVYQEDGTHLFCHF